MLTRRIFLFLLVAGTVAACSKDDLQTTEGPQKDQVLKIEAGTPEFQAEDMSRAGYDGTNAIWHAADEIGVSFDANNVNRQFTQVAGSLSSDSRRVTYTGTTTGLSGNVTAVAYYPYSASATVSGKTITTTFPATQTYNAAGGYRGIPLFSTFTGDFNNIQLAFKNLYSVVKVTLNKGVSLPATVNLQKIYFQGNNNEVISGPMQVNLSGASPVVSYTGTGKTVMLDLGAGVPLTSTNKSFYIAVPAINYTKGYSFTFVTDQGQITKSAKNTGANYAVNKIYAAPALTINSLSLVSIPDLNLRNALQSLGLISILDPLSGLVSITTAGLQAASIDISGKNIVDLTGLSNFPALLTLKAGNNEIATADLSKLTLLTNLDLSGNQLTGLDLSANLALASIDVSSNELTSLDLHHNTLLTSVKVYGNPLVTLNVSGLTLMTALYLDHDNPTANAISGLTLTIPTNATVQNLVAQAMTVSPWTSFVCSNNPTIQSIDLSGNVKLLSATVTNNGSLTSLNLSGNILLTTLRAHGTGSSVLTTLNISGMKALTTLYFSSANTNSISLLTLTIPSSTKIKNIIADGALLVGTWTSFVCSNNPNVQTISLKNNIGLLGVTVTNNNSLTSLAITGSGLGLAGVISSGNASGFTVIQ